MAKIRNLLIGAAALALLLVSIASPSGASTSYSQSKFIRSIHTWLPATKHFTQRHLVAAGTAICQGVEHYVLGYVRKDGAPLGNAEMDAYEVTAVEAEFG